MACEAGKRTNLPAPIPNRPNRARGQTQAQQRQPMTQNNGNARWLKETDNVEFWIDTSICRWVAGEFRNLAGSFLKS